MYGKIIYGLEKYGNDKAQEGSQDEYFVDLAHYAPPFLAEIRELAEIYRTQGFEAGQLQHDMEDILDQCFVQTATWGLLRWEVVYGIVTNMSLTYEQRREIILARIRGQGTTTRQMIEDTAAAFSGGEVGVIEDNPNHRFVVQFVGIKGIPRNMNAFVSALEDIKPAHMAYEFEYRYTVWKEMKTYSWSSLNGMIWNDVRTLKEA